MIEFYKNLQGREKKLLLLSLSFVFLFTIFLYASGTYNSYKISLKNYSKAKSEYEYVYKRVSNLKNSIKSFEINKNNINLLLEEEKLTNAINDIFIDTTSSKKVITFNASNISDAVYFSEQLINQSQISIKAIKYKNSDDDYIQVELIYD